MRLTRGPVAVLVVALAVPVALPSPAGAAAYSCTGIDRSTERSATTDPSVPYELLGIDRAADLLKQRGITPGAGVTVAVVDSGVDVGGEPMAPLTVSGEQRFGTTEPVSYGHGTNVAGLVAGGAREDGRPTGIAPGAEIYDIRVYDEPGDDGSGGIGQSEVIDAVRWLAENAESEGIGVVVTAFSIADKPALRQAIHALSQRDVVIVAASGNRPTEGQNGFDDYGEQAPGEDAAGFTYPAGYADDVFALTSTAAGVPPEDGRLPDASGAVLLSSAIDAAVPTFGAVTVALNGATCQIDEIATSWAAGVGAGVVALVRSAYPKENADQIEARLLASASGRYTAPTTSTGAGVLQPVEALTRQFAPARNGDLDDMPREEPVRPRVTAPVVAPDPVTSTLAQARWWGLFGGAALVIALLGRPLLRRRD